MLPVFRSEARRSDSTDFNNTLTSSLYMMLALAAGPRWNRYACEGSDMLARREERGLGELEMRVGLWLVALMVVDSAFHDEKGAPGFDFVIREWLQRWTGAGKPHGVVF
jgi:hypothetical protein